MICSDIPPPPTNGCDPRLMGRNKSARIGWQYEEGCVVEAFDALLFHPVDWCRLIRKSHGSNVALEHLRRYLHIRIDQRFNGIKK